MFQLSTRSCLRARFLALATLVCLVPSVSAICPEPTPINLDNGTYKMPRAPQDGARWTLGRQFDRVLLVLLENQDFDAVSRHPAMQALARRGAQLSQYRGTFHPSYSNYLALVGGRYFGAQADNQTDIDVGVPTIADLLEQKGLTWKQYAEGYPGSCYLGDQVAAARYARKHVPFLSFASVHRNPGRCANVVPASQFDPQTLPNFGFYTPDLCDDGHDACMAGKSNLDQAMDWLARFLAPMLSSTQLMSRTLIIVAFDESRTYANNHTFALFLGGMVRQGFEATGCYDHYNVLRTVEDNFQLGNLGGEDANSSPIISVWKSGP
jgi:hypothetical protein